MVYDRRPPRPCAGHMAKFFVIKGRAVSAVLGCILFLIVICEIPCYLFRGLVVPTVVDMLAVAGAIHPLMNLR